MQDKHIIATATGVSVVVLLVAVVMIYSEPSKPAVSTSVGDTSRSYSPSHGPSNREADRALSAAGQDPNQVSSSKKADLQRSIEKLARTLERNEREAPSQLSRARDYARGEFERNKGVMSSVEARRQYERDLATIEQEERDRGVR